MSYLHLIAIVCGLLVRAVAAASDWTDLYEPNGTITSWGTYGEESDLDLGWPVQLNTLMKFTITVHKLSLMESRWCRAEDSLVVKRSDWSAIAGSFCDTINEADNVTISFIDYGFLVKFQTQRSVEGIYGFTLTYTSARPEDLEICDTMHDDYWKEISSEFLGAVYMYPVNLSCSWNISVNDDSSIRVDVDLFNIEFSGNGCIYDRLEIWEIADEDISISDQRLGRFCGRRQPWTVSVHSHKARITFVTDSRNYRYGFLLRYSPEPLEYSVREIQLEQLRATPESVSRTFPGQDLFRGEPIKVLLHIRTYPGFYIQADFNETIRDGTFLVYDGPDRAFPKINVQGMNRIKSNGFHLLFEQIVLNYTGSAWEVEFRALSAFTPDRTVVSYVRTDTSDIYRENKNGTDLHACCDYGRIMGHQAMKVLSITELYTWLRPNTDDCEYFGIVFFDERMTFDGIIGPFCEVLPFYLKTVVKDFMSSSSVVYIVLYDYTQVLDVDGKRVSATAVNFSPAPCIGYYVTAPILEGMSIEDEAFPLEIRPQNNTLIISLGYNQKPNECVMVHFLAESTKHATRLLFQTALSENIRYRVCRRYGIATPLKRSDKYNTEESCNEIHSDRSEITLGGSVVENKGWATEYIRLELGEVDKNFCREIDIWCFPDERQINVSHPCGALLHWAPRDCHWLMTVPQGWDSLAYQWFFEVNEISSGMVETLVIEELIVPSEDWRLKYRLLPYKLASTDDNRPIRIFRYRTADAVGTVVRPENLEYVNIRFTLIDKSSNSSIKSEINNKCHYFSGHCYTFLTFGGILTSWNDAANNCSSAGGRMVSINSIAELEFIKGSLASMWKEKFYGQNYGSIFIGLSNWEMSDEYKWVDGSPLTVSDWYYPFDAFNNILPVEPPSDEERNKIQPTYDERLRCVAMDVGNPFLSTNWKKIDCQATALIGHVNTICEFETSSPNATLADEFVQDGGYECPDGWTFVSNSCLVILTADISIVDSIGAAEAIRMCKSYGGDLASLNRISIYAIENYLLSAGFFSWTGRIWVEFPSWEMGCISLSPIDGIEVYDERYNLTNHAEACFSRDGRIPHVLCEHQVQNIPTCPSHLFQCSDGTCLSATRICDGHSDCQDGRDEYGCSGVYDIYTCGDELVISINKYCDFHGDCPDGSDETACIHPACSELQSRCANGECVSKGQWCDHKADCIDGSDEESCDWTLNCPGFECPAVGCIPKSKFHDIQPDCPDFSQADEVQQLSSHQRYLYYEDHPDSFYPILRENFRSYCPGHTNHERCHPNRATCFPRHKSCIYDHDQYGQVRYCRNGAHLKHCESVKCPGMFKCPKSYCLPFAKVCDGVRDCVDGADESICTNRTCAGQFRCGEGSQCVSLEDLCDGRTNCNSNWADEQFCDLESFHCPQNCTCRGYVISCRGRSDLPHMRISANVRVLDLDQNRQQLSKSTLEEFLYLTILVLSNNQLNYIPVQHFENLSNLLHLDLSQNLLQEFRSGTFGGLVNLLTLKLDGNPLSFVEKGSFQGLSALPELHLGGLMISVLPDEVFLGLEELKVLNLSNNGIRSIELHAFTPVLPLGLLLLDGNPLDETTGEIFDSLRVEAMRTDSYRFCCFAGRYVTDCTPDGDVFNSCSDLLANKFMQVIVWMFGILAAVGNLSVICWRLVTKLNNSPSVFVLHLSLSDLLMAVYLLCLASVDTQYRGSYILHDQEWRDSGFCHFIGAIATLSCEMSIFTLFCIAVDRTKRLVYTFDTSQFTPKTAWYAMIIGWICSLVIAVVPFTAPSYFGNYYGRNAICLPLNLSESRGQGWEFATCVFVGLNMVILLLIFLMYGKIYGSVKETQTKAARGDRSDLDVARRLSMVILTNVVCFIPLILVNIAADLGHPVNRDIVSFMTTAVLPVNAALNPYLFTFSTCRSKKPSIKAKHPQPK